MHVPLKQSKLFPHLLVWTIEEIQRIQLKCQVKCKQYGMMHGLCSCKVHLCIQLFVQVLTSKTPYHVHTLSHCTLLHKHSIRYNMTHYWGTLADLHNNIIYYSKFIHASMQVHAMDIHQLTIHDPCTVQWGYCINCTHISSLSTVYQCILQNTHSYCLHHKFHCSTVYNHCTLQFLLEYVRKTILWCFKHTSIHV